MKNLLKIFILSTLFFIPLFFANAGLPDLITLSNVTPTTAVAGVPKTFSTVIKNQGTASTGIAFQSAIKYCLNPLDIDIATGLPRNQLLYKVSTPIINVGGTYVISYALTFPSPGTYYLRGYADIDWALTEIDHNNNGGTWIQINVSPASTTVSVTASPTTYNTIPSVNVPFGYSASTNTGTVECRLLNNMSSALTSYAAYPANNPIRYTPPTTPGSYGYYVQCRNTTTTSATATSALITVNVTSSNVVPTVTTPTATSITQTGATIGANVTSLGTPAVISARGTCLGTTANPTNCTPATGTTLGVFTQVKTGLIPNTLYYYRGYATNATGTGYSTGGTFTTGAITVSVTASPTTYNTIPSTNVPFGYSASTNTGTVECRLLDNTSSALTSYAAYPGNNPIQYAPPASPGSYGYYVQCRNATTTSTTATSALITANVITVSVNASPTTYNVAPSSNISFTYTPTTNIGATECRLLDNVSTALTSYQASSPIIRAAPAIVGAYGYYVQCRNKTTTTALATSVLITANVSITNVAPTLSSSTVSGVTTSGATLGATVDSLGIPATISARGTCWGTTANPTTNCVAQGGTTTGIFTQARTGLTQGTLYHYRGYATNTTGTGYSPDATFTTGSTSNNPVVDSSTATSVTTTSATIGANLSSLGTPASVSEEGFCYGTSPNPVTNCTATSSGVTAPAIGGSYGGGKVAYILQAGDPGYVAGQVNGLIVSASEIGGGIRWYNGSNTTTGATATAIGTGLANSNTIRTSQGTTYTSYAAGLARAYNSGGYSDWYLPSRDELKKVCANKVAIGGLNAWDHWSSSEQNASNAWFVYFGDCGSWYTPKSSSSLFPLAVRSFQILSATITTGVFSKNLSGLTTNTLYYFRGYATNSSGTGYSPDGTFTTATSGTISASGCTISVNQTGCNTNLNWNTVNPVVTSVVKTGATIVANANLGTNFAYTIPSGLKSFDLWHNGVLLASASATAVCANTTHWNGSICILDNPTTSFSATPTTLFKGKSSTLTWDSPIATSCSGSTNNSEVFNTGGNTSGSVTVSPLSTTTYTLRCTNMSGATDNTVITKVITLQIKEN